MTQQQKKFIGVSVLLLGFIIITIMLNSIEKSIKSTQLIKDLEDQNKFLEIQLVINNQFEEFEGPSFMSRKIKYAEEGINTVYFVNGYKTTIKETGIDYEENVNYLVVSNGIYYDIDEISEPDIDKFAKEYLDKYEIINLEVSDENVIPSIDYDESAILKFYIANFSELVKVDPQKAYALLSDNEKKTYTSYEDLKNSFDLNIDTDIESFNKKGNTYTIRDYNENIITIKENKLLDYTIEFE